MSQVIQQEALTRLLVEKKIFTSSTVKTEYGSPKKGHDFG
jgi:hypothetical protein